MESNKDDKIVSEIIKESWERCRAFGVDREHGKGKRVSEPEMDEIFKKNEGLMSVAIPLMKRMYQVVKGSGFSVMLTDGNGYVLETIGDEEIMKKAEELNFLKGAIWTEEAVGTNAIGTAIHIDQPLQTIGTQHYCKTQHSWTCSAAPIHDEKGNVIGCIDMSGESGKAHIHTLGMVITAAYSIESQMEIIRSNTLINATFSSINDGMIILDENMKISRLNEQACEILGYSSQELTKKDMHLITKDRELKSEISAIDEYYQNLDYAIYTRDGKMIKCIIKAVPVKSSGKSMGTVITFKPSSQINKIVNKVAGYKAVYRFRDIVTNDRKMKETISYARKIADTDCSVMITGESGTGKELFAQAIHNHSYRAEEPFLAINCALIPGELIESELFGYEKGAFTGADKSGRPGKFEIADGGTVFLDEIGEMPLEMQSKLLRFLDNKKINRIGASYEKTVDVRIIAATNRDLLEEISKNNFRLDLYYRLSVMNIEIIKLDDRKEDIELLARHFTEKLNEAHDKKKTLSSRYIDMLKSRSWKGNVRELQNVVFRDYYLCESDELTVSSGEMIMNDLEPEKQKNVPSEIIDIGQAEAANIMTVLSSCGWDVQRAAEIFGMSRATLYRKMKKYEIKRHGE